MSRPRCYRSLLFFLLGLFLVCAALRAQLPDSPAPPDHPASAMYTLEDLYNRLANGADGMLRGAGFVEPPTGPLASGRTLNEIMGTAPLADDGSGLGVSQCAAGRTFWSLLTASWGPQVCTAPDIGQESFTPGAGPQAISAGFHDGTGRVAGDLDLAPKNIADGVEIFGVNGSAPLASGAATDSQVLAGITYSSDSGASTGTMPDIGQQSFTPGTSDQAIALGFHDGAGTVAGDSDLAPQNITDGVEIFGVNGSASWRAGQRPIRKSSPASPTPATPERAPERCPTSASRALPPEPVTRRSRSAFTTAPALSPEISISRHRTSPTGWRSSA